MANIIKIKRGLSKNLSQANLQEGEMAFTTDTKKLYISNTDEPINNNTTYSLSKSGSTITLTGSDGSKTSVTDADTNTTYNAATTSANGLMTSAMVTKLNGIADGANKYSLPTASASTLGGVKVGTNLTISSGVLSAKDTTYSAATTSTAGLMSAADKTKLDGIAEGANKYTYTLPTASSTLGGVKTTSTVTSTSGLTACPIISGVPYYKDTNTTYTLPNATSSTLGGVKIGSNITISSGTISLTKENVTTALGYTPPTANTDTKATQTDTTTSGNYRIILSTNANDTTETNTLRKSGKFWANPSTGAFYATGYNRVDITGQTLDIDTLNLSAGSPEIVRYVEKTSGGSSNITNIPVAGYAFILDIELIRWASTTDYVTRQTFTSVNDVNHEYVRYCTSGTWKAWTKRIFTDNNTTYSAATQSAAGLMSAADKKKLDGVATGANNYTYTLPSATSSVLGGVKVGSNITVSSGTISLTKDNVTGALGYTPPTTNTTYSNMTAATSSAAGKAGLVPAPAAGKQASFLRGDGTWVVPTNTTYSNMTAATSSAAGKAGLVPAPAAGKQASFLRGDGTWVVPTNTTYSAATTSAAGLMSAADKTKLDGIATGANKYSLPTASSSTLGGIKVGTNLSISNGVLSATNTTYSAATTSANGLMSSSDKTKLNGIATGAQVNNVIVSTSQPSSGDVWINPNGQMTNSLSPHIGKHIRVGQNASTSIPNKSTTTVTFNTTILNTAGSLLTLTSNGIKIGAGISKVIVNARWTCWGSFARYAYIYVNGNQHTFHMNQTGSTTQDTAFLDVVEGDVIYFKCYQESGSTQTTATSQHQTFMDVMIIG